MLLFVPSTRCMDVNHYARLDEGLTELPQDRGLLSPNEVEAPGIIIINNIRIEMEE